MNKQSILQYGRLLCLILFYTFLAETGINAQEETRITLELKNVSLGTAIEEIEKQSPYLFFNKGVDPVGTKVKKKKVFCFDRCPQRNSCTKPLTGIPRVLFLSTKTHI